MKNETKGIVRATVAFKENTLKQIRLIKVNYGFDQQDIIELALEDFLKEHFIDDKTSNREIKEIEERIKELKKTREYSIHKKE